MSKPATRKELYLVARYEVAKRRAAKDWEESPSLGSPENRLSYHLEMISTEVPDDFPQVGCDAKTEAA